jgi:hypothetical protein
VSLPLGVFLVLFGFGQSVWAGSISYCTPSGSTTKDGSVDAMASFITSSGGVTLTLTNLLENPTADGQLLSAIEFKVSGATGSGASTANSGQISTISSGGSYTSPAADALTRWKLSESGTQIDITTLSGGKPNRLIIGPDDNGGFDPSLGAYTNANASIIQHNPSVLGSAVFTISIPGVTDVSQISDVVFQFGTLAGSNTVIGEICGADPVPEPGTLTLLGFGVAGVCVYGWRLRKLAKA